MGKKIGLVGYLGYAVDNPIIGGQMSKTRGVYRELVRAFGKDVIEVIDTSNWQNERGKLIKQCWKMTHDCSTIIIMPNKNGIKIILPFFALFKPFRKYGLAYPVVGGWLTELLKHCRYLARSIKAVDYILPETNELKEELCAFVSCKMDVMPIFSTKKALSNLKIQRDYEEPFPFCTFSRVTPEKGIDDAVKAIVEVNQTASRIICILDIWGPIELGYEEHYQELFRQYTDCIKYKGVLSGENCLEKLEPYYMLLFPTFYPGEGFPTTVCEAYMAGLPVIASDWRFNKEIVKQNETGFLFEAKKVGDLKNCILQAITDPQRVQVMKQTCWEFSKSLSPEYAMSDLLQWIDSQES